jgi:hypothetical protein
MTVVAGKFDVDALWDSAKNGPYVVPFNGDAVKWNFNVGSEHALDCVIKHTAGADAKAVDNFAAKLKGDNLPAAAQSFTGLVQLVSYYQQAQHKDFTQNLDADDLGDVAYVGLWEKAAREAYVRMSEIGWTPAKKAALDSLMADDTWSHANLAQSFELLGIGPYDPKTSDSVHMLGLVRGIYLRRLNEQVTATAAALKAANMSGLDSATRLVLQEIGLGFEKETRVGPGNGIALEDGNLFFPIANNPLVMGPKLGSIQCMDGRAINEGSERQAASLGMKGTNEVLLMSMRRKHMPPAATDGTFDLSKWTRTFSVSWQTGDAWQNEIDWAPDYAKPTFNVNKVAQLHSDQKAEDWATPYDATPGFKDSQVQGTVVAVKGFFGPGRNLVIHGHPQNNLRGMERGDKQFSIRDCVGSNPGDATKEDTRCDFRSHYTLIPGEPNLVDAKMHERPVNWSFGHDAKALTTYGAGYSAIASLGAIDCQTALIAALVETASRDDAASYRGFNDSIRVFLVQVGGGHFKGQHLDACRL